MAQSRCTQLPTAPTSFITTKALFHVGLQYIKSARYHVTAIGSCYWTVYGGGGRRRLAGALARGPAVASGVACIACYVVQDVGGQETAYMSALVPGPNPNVESVALQ